MINEHEAVRAITKMVRDTAEGRLAWRRISPTASMNLMSLHNVEWAYIAHFQTWQIATFEITERAYDGETDSYYNARIPVIAILHEDKQVAFVFPLTGATHDLLTTVQAQATNARGFIEAILKG